MTARRGRRNRVYFTVGAAPPSHVQIIRPPYDWATDPDYRTDPTQGETHEAIR